MLSERCEEGGKGVNDREKDLWCSGIINWLLGKASISGSEPSSVNACKRAHSFYLAACLFLFLCISRSFYLSLFAVSRKVVGLTCNSLVCDFFFFSFFPPIFFKTRQTACLQKRWLSTFCAKVGRLLQFFTVLFSIVLQFLIH